MATASPKGALAAQAAGSNRMIRMRSATLVFGMLACLALCGCGDGYDNEEAVAACDAVKQADAANDNCMSDADFQACVTCHEECGDLCAVIDTVCPPIFSCDE